MTHVRNVLVFISFYIRHCHFLLEGSIFMSCLKAMEQWIFIFDLTQRTFYAFGDNHGNVTVSEDFSDLMVLLFEKILNKDCYRLALLTPILCETKISIVPAFLGAVYFYFHHGNKVVVCHGDSHSSQYCTRHQCRRWHVAVIAKGKRKQHGLKLVLGTLRVFCMAL